MTTENAAKLETVLIRHHGLERLANISPGGDSIFGSTHSEETRKKLSEFNKGKTLSAEHRLKLSIAHKGVKRGPMSLEQRRKLSVIKTGTIGTNTGKKYSDEHKRKISEAHKGKVIAEETKIKRSDPTIYNFKHETYGFVSCTQRELRMKFTLHQAHVSALVKCKLKTHKGWELINAVGQ